MFVLSDLHQIENWDEQSLTITTTHVYCGNEFEKN